MTTHYEKIQALGNRMASNLETMGVSASFSDGGLTLADKILQIQHFTDGLLLYADEKVIQTGDTVNLYALLLQDGKTVSGETIKFDFGTNVYSKQVSLSDDLYDDYYVESSKTGSNYDYIGTAHSGFIQFNSSIIKTYVTSYSPEVTYNGEPFHIKNGILTYKDTSDVERTIDVSAIDTSKAYSGAACTIHYHWVEATTGSDSVATVSYTGVGVGKLNVQAKTIDGSVQSETYSILDAIYYDDCGTDTKSKYYINDADGTAKSYENNSIKVVCGTNSNRNYLFLRTQENSGLLASLQGNTVKFKCDITGLNGKTVKAQIRYNASTSSGYTSITSDRTIETNSLTIPSDATNVSFEIAPEYWSSGDTYYCKNFTVYPV